MNRENDLKMLGELLDEHAGELTETELEAFADMRLSLRLYGNTTQSRFQQLTDSQRDWARRVRDRIVIPYENLVSSGLAAKGDPTPESKVLDAMLAKPKVLRPPTKKKRDD